MSKITLDNVNNIDAITTINANFDKIEQELQNKVLYRDNPPGEPNTLQTDLDANGKRIYNVGAIELDGNVLAPIEDVEALTASATASASAASTSASNAATSASNASTSATNANNSAIAAAASAASMSGNLLGVTTFTSSGSYTPNANMAFAIVEMVGGGGAGAGVNTASMAVGGGGASGQYLKMLLTRAQVLSLVSAGVVPITIGAGGAGSSLAGVAGGDTLFGTTGLVAPGGQGGNAAAGSATSGVASGGFNTGTSVTAPGTVLTALTSAPGGTGFWVNGTLMMSGSGGTSPFGIGAAGTGVNLATGTAAGGSPSSGYGNGGSGAASTSAGGIKNGGSGRGGFVMISEYK